MSTIKDKVMEQMKTAMKAKDQVALLTLRSLKAALTNASIEKGSLSTELTDAEEMAVVRKQLKQRQDSFEQYTKADRTDLADKESAEMVILNTFLPEPLSAEELENIVDTVINELGASSKKDMGKVMKEVQVRCAGRADGKTCSQIIGKKLA